MGQMGSLVPESNQSPDPTIPPAAGSQTKPEAVKEAEGEKMDPKFATYRRQSQESRLKAYEAGRKVQLVVPANSYKKIRTYRKPNLKPNCNRYLRSITRDHNPTRKTLIGHFCLKEVGAKP
ncbi:hypothetical protein QAD02_001838 [Eretmocerus hayati]|uniref:Uncharacterized protein n=1 Tax=Eretmocerus hayati TaxID=131215 RepID=A0ACC2NJU3_9HYME|nr:hypothetical protein QAD02_001838 [Eretmocerus hayati]